MFDVKALLREKLQRSPPHRSLQSKSSNASHVHRLIPVIYHSEKHKNHIGLQVLWENKQIE